MKGGVSEQGLSLHGVDGWHLCLRGFCATVTRRFGAVWAQGHLSPALGLGELVTSRAPSRLQRSLASQTCQPSHHPQNSHYSLCLVLKGLQSGAYRMNLHALCMHGQSHGPPKHPHPTPHTTHPPRPSPSPAIHLASEKPIHRATRASLQTNTSKTQTKTPS